jgi:hypothetical protein
LTQLFAPATRQSRALLACCHRRFWSTFR